MFGATWGEVPAGAVKIQRGEYYDPEYRSNKYIISHDADRGWSPTPVMRRSRELRTSSMRGGPRTVRGEYDSAVTGLHLIGAATTGPTLVEIQSWRDMQR